MAATMPSLGNWQEAIDNLVKRVKDTEDFEEFKGLQTDEERIQFVFDKRYLEQVPWLQTFLLHCHLMKRKSAEKASSLRAEGNSLFQRRQYRKALEAYNKSVLVAPQTADCPELALALGNRSATLYHLQQYQDCLRDIQRAEEAGYPECNRHKLLKRRSDCLDQLKKLGQMPLPESSSNQHRAGCSAGGEMGAQPGRAAVQVTGGSSPVLTQASATVELCCSAEKGRFLQARQEVRAGDVLIVERPFAAVLLPDHYLSHCHHCLGLLSSPPVPCRECSVVRYCSQECQQLSWQRYHQMECSYLPLMHSIGIAHLSLRVVLTAEFQFLKNFVSGERAGQRRDRVGGVDEEGRYSFGYLSVYDLLTHTLDMQTEDLFHYSLTGALLLVVLVHAGWFLEDAGPSLEEADLERLTLEKCQDCREPKSSGTATACDSARPSQPGCLAPSCAQPDTATDPQTACRPGKEAGAKENPVRPASCEGSGPQERAEGSPCREGVTTQAGLSDAGGEEDSQLTGGPGLVSEGELTGRGYGEDTADDPLDLSHWTPHAVTRRDALLVGSLLLRHIQQLVCNAHAVTALRTEDAGDAELVQTHSQQRIATAIFPTASLMNHACSATILSSFDRDTLVVRAVKDVPIGGEIFNCYGPDSRRMEWEERQRHLLEQYFFLCKCPDCVAGTHHLLQFQALKCVLCGGRVRHSDTDSRCWDCGQTDHCQGTADKARAADDLFVRGLQALQSSHVTGALEHFRQCRTLREEALYPSHRHLGEVCDCQARCHAMLGQFQEAADCLQPSLRITELQFGADSLQLGYELHKAAQILFNAGRPRQALPVMTRASNILTTHLGAAHDLVTELQEMRTCLLQFLEESGTAP